MTLPPAAPRDDGPSCPLPVTDRKRIVLAHGGGGHLMRQLIEQVFLPTFDNEPLAARADSALLPIETARIAFTTDSYVVRPLFFPGGDIGRLAVIGTVNDLAMCGARPKWLSAGFIVEEGLDLNVLQTVAGSMRAAADACGVQIVTGDTKVVERGRGDGIYVNTAGLGLVEHGLDIAPRSVRPDDVILLSGDIGRHGIAVMARREGLAFETTLASDLEALHEPVLALLHAGIEIHCLRDLTRGGLSAALHEIASTASLGLDLQEAAIPVHPDVAAACELLGFDPLQIACEGRFVAFVPRAQASQALDILRAHGVGRHAVAIGDVRPNLASPVTLVTATGVRRPLDMPAGELLPRIC
jgi:hydrogenase expression/formation protein HypE